MYFSRHIGKGELFLLKYAANKVGRALPAKFEKGVLSRGLQMECTPYKATRPVMK